MIKLQDFFLKTVFFFWYTPVFDPRQNLIHTTFLTHANHAISLTHAKILCTHATHATYQSTHPRYPRRPCYLADSE